MSEASRLVTADELEHYPDDDIRYELVDGRVIRMSPVGFQHGRVVARLLARLEQHTSAHNLGAAMTEVGFKLKAKPDTVRAPDVAFIRRDRIPSPGPRGFWKGAPDLAIEVLSPEDEPADIRSKVNEYLACGVTLVVVLDPDLEIATLLRPGVEHVVVRADGTLDLGDVVDEFRCTLREILG
jgi:Uma2 family endonuclease